MKLCDDPLIIVTGGAGFIGSCVIRQLNDQGLTNIVIVDELGKTEKWQNLIGKRFLDIISKEQFFQWLEGRESEINTIIHLGACTDTTEIDADYLLENNYRFSVKLAEYAMKNNIRFIYASSAATYGDGQIGFSDDHAMLEQLRPLNMYGMSKHLFDLWLKGQGLLDRVVGLKYFNVFGPNEWHKGRMASAITHFVPTVQKEGVVRLFKSSDPQRYADGEQQRDFIYVKDAARITCAFLNTDACGIFNVGSGKPDTWNQLANAVFSALGHSAKIEYVPMPVDLIGKYQNFSCAKKDKLKSALGSLANCMPLEKAVIEYVRNHLVSRKIW